MSSLVSPYEQNILTGLFSQTFDTFSQNRIITVWKTPIKTAIPVSQEPQGTFGFGNAPAEQQYEYTPVSGQFPAVIRYVSMRHIGEVEVLDNTNAMIPIGECRIRVRPDCYNFIENGTTDKISFDDRDWYFAGKPQATPFLGSSYYFYQLKPKI